MSSLNQTGGSNRQETNKEKRTALSVAARRIASDLKQLGTDDLVGIAALPMDDNLFEWHINVAARSGPLKGVYIHCIMKFTNEYPTRPPKVQCCTPNYGHVNVFESYSGEQGFICLSMLEAKLHTWQSYEGWSSAYSLSSILMQLQSFLLDESKLRRNLKAGKESCRRFRCSRCTHSHNQPWPEVRFKPRTVPKDITCDTNSYAPWTDLPQDLSSLMFSFLDSVSMFRSSWTCREWLSVCNRYNLVIRREMVCYHSKLDYQHCVLGFGMKLTSPDHSRRKTFKMQMDYLSNVAWESGARSSVWGETLTHWIPIIINNSHGNRALPLLLESLKFVDSNPLTAIARLMNGIVVNLAESVTTNHRSMSRYSGYSYDGGLIMSEKALVGYFALHQTLIWLLHNDPKLSRFARSRANQLRHGRDMSKKRIPDLGESLVYLSCVDGISWDDVRDNFLREGWTRRVYWYTRDDSTLNRPNAGNCMHIFEKTRVSRALVSFQVFFLTEVCASAESTEAMLANYNQKLGRPSSGSILKLHQFCKEYQSMTNESSVEEEYSFYWKHMGWGRVPSKTQFVDWLKQSVKASSEVGYHVKQVISDREAFLAAHSGNVGTMKRYLNDLVEEGRSIDVTDSNGRTLVHFAGRAGNDRIVKMLIDCGANLRLQDQSGQTAVEAVKEVLKSKSSEQIKSRRERVVAMIDEAIETQQKAKTKKVEQKKGTKKKSISLTEQQTSFDCELCVRNLPNGCSSADLKSLLRRCGFRVPKQEMNIRTSAVGKPFALVSVSKTTDDVIRNANGHMFRGGAVSIEKSRRSRVEPRREDSKEKESTKSVGGSSEEEESAPPSDSLFVTRLDVETEDEVRDLITKKFGKFGFFGRRPYVNLDRNGNFYAFVTFDSTRGAVRAKKALDGVKVGELNLVVKFKKSPSPVSSFSGSNRSRRSSSVQNGVSRNGRGGSRGGFSRGRGRRGSGRRGR